MYKFLIHPVHERTREGLMSDVGCTNVLGSLLMSLKSYCMYDVTWQCLSVPLVQFGCTRACTLIWDTLTIKVLGTCAMYIPVPLGHSCNSNHVHVHELYYVNMTCVLHMLM